MNTSKAIIKGKTKRGRRGAGYLYKRSGVFWLDYQAGDDRIRRALKDANGKPITTRKEAEAERMKIVAPFLADDELEAQVQVLARIQKATEDVEVAVENAKARLLIKDCWKEYLRNSNRPDSGEATLESYSLQWNRFVVWMTEENPKVIELHDVTPDHASGYVGYLWARKITANTYNKHVRLLELVFRILGDKAGCNTNPFKGITRKKQKKNHRRELTTPELSRLINGTEGEFRLFLALGLYTGLRRSDCCTLLWDEVDLKRKIITRVPNKTARTNGIEVKIPMNNDLYSMLRKSKKIATDMRVLPGLADLYEKRVDTLTAKIKQHFWNCGIDVHKKGTGTQIVREQNGTPQRQPKTGNVITEYTGTPAVVAVGFHSLRHSFVSLCREADTPLSVVESIVGHSNPTMTRLYSHTSDKEAKRAVAALPSFAGGKVKEHREPLPEWARGLIEGLTVKNCKQVKAELLKGGE